MNNFIRNIVCVCPLFMFISCGPTTYLYDLESKRKAEKDVSLYDKKVAILIDETGAKEDSLVYTAFASGVANKIEQELGFSSETLPVFVGDIRPKDESKNELLNKFSDSDILFIIDDISVEDMRVVSQRLDPYVGMVDTYIAIDINKTTYLYDIKESKLLDNGVGRDTMIWSMHSDYYISKKDILKKVEELKYEMYFEFGGLIASEFFSTWKTEQRRFLVYHSGNDWAKAYRYATDFKWKLAADIWVKMINSSSPQKVSAAAYNLAVACEINGDYKLAKKWLDYSDKIYKYPESRSERSIIERKSKSADIKTKK